MIFCNKRPKNNSLFSRELKSHSSSTAEILKSLSTLFGCVYLANNGNPIIGFLPESYCINLCDVYHVFLRDKDMKYKKINFLGSPNDYVSFDHPSQDPNQSFFQGGYIGFIDYNHAANLQIKSQKKTQPNVYLGCYKTFIENVNNQWIFKSYEDNASDIYNLLEKTINQEVQSSFNMNSLCTPSWEKTQYKEVFEKVQNYIKAGDCYQINLTQEFSAKAKGRLIDTAENFWKLTNAPYAGYLKLDDFELLSCSPELFIDFEADRKIITKPIKGTMPRYADSQLDEQSKQALKCSEKDRAENVMIVDLLRNDLSVFAEIGSVKTPKLFNIESFNQVHHMVSEIEATLRPEVNPLDVLLHSLPGGSITGAPKIRAMEIIEELEVAPRGAYCGSMGYFNFDGTGSWNILIRTIQKYQDNVSIWAGGGITIASDCDAEYQECFDKVSAMLDLLNTWN